MGTVTLTKILQILITIILIGIMPIRIILEIEKKDDDLPKLNKNDRIYLYAVTIIEIVILILTFDKQNSILYTVSIVSVTAILNITPDHLNRHHTMENYVACKESITKNQTGDDVCVLNYEDQYLKDFAPKCPARVIWFSSKTKLDEGLYLDGDDICYARNGRVERLMI